MDPRPYQPKKITPLRLLAMGLRALAGLLGHWPLFVVIAVLASPISPHVLVTYEYRHAAYGHSFKTHCRYLGARGWVEVTPNDDCPFIALLDTRRGYL